MFSTAHRYFTPSTSGKLLHIPNFLVNVISSTPRYVPFPYTFVVTLIYLSLSLDFSHVQKRAYIISDFSRVCQDICMVLQHSRLTKRHSLSFCVTLHLLVITISFPIILQAIFEFTVCRSFWNIFKKYSYFVFEIYNFVNPLKSCHIYFFFL